MKTHFVLAGLAALAVPVTASAQTVDAREPDDSAAIAAAVRYAMPHFIAGVRTACADALSPNGYFAREGDALIARYTEGSDEAWPQARALLLDEMQSKAGEDEAAGSAIQDMPDEALKPFVNAMIPSLIASEIAEEDCGDVERIVEAFAPLPPQNFARLISTVVRLAERSERREKEAEANQDSND